MAISIKQPDWKSLQTMSSNDGYNQQLLHLPLRSNGFVLLGCIQSVTLIAALFEKSVLRVDTRSSYRLFFLDHANIRLLGNRTAATCGKRYATSHRVVLINILRLMKVAFSQGQIQRTSAELTAQKRVKYKLCNELCRHYFSDKTYCCDMKTCNSLENMDFNVEINILHARYSFFKKPIELVLHTEKYN